MKRKRRPLPYIAPPAAIPGVEIALSRHLWRRALAQTEALEMANADEQTMERSIAIHSDLCERFVFTARIRAN